MAPPASGPAPRGPAGGTAVPPPAPDADLDVLFGAMRVEATITIAAPVRSVWTGLTDLAAVPDHSPEVIAVRFLDGHDRLGPGARFEGTNRQRADTLPAGLGLGGGEHLTWTRRCTVTWFAPPAGFAYAVADRFGGTTGTWTSVLTRSGSGTHVRQLFAHDARGRSGIRIAADQDPAQATAIIARRRAQLLAGMRHTLRSYRDLLEGAGPTRS